MELLPATTLATAIVKQEKEDEDNIVLTPDTWADFTFILGQEKKEVKVHKTILSAGSKVFKNIFETNKDFTFLEITDLEEVKGFPLFMKYFYTKEAPTEVEECTSVLLLAVKYATDDLGNKCWILLQEKMPTHERQIFTFRLSIRNGNTELEKEAIQVLCRNGSRVLKCQQFLHLTVEELRKILVKDDLEVKREIEIFEAVMGWGRSECKRKKIPDSTDNIRSAVERLTKLIRFPCMSIQEFSKVVLTNVLSLTEVGNILQRIDVKPDDNSSASRPRGFDFIAKPRKIYSPKGPILILQRLVKESGLLFLPSMVFGYSYKKTSHLLRVRSNMSIWISSVGLNSTRRLRDPDNRVETSDMILVQVDVKDSTNKKIMQTEQQTVTGVLDRTEDVYHVQFKKPAFLHENEWYTLAVRISGAFHGNRYVPPNNGLGNSLDFPLPEDGGTVKFEFEKAGGGNGIQHFMPEIGFMVY